MNIVIRIFKFIFNVTELILDWIVPITIVFFGSIGLYWLYDKYLKKKNE